MVTSNSPTALRWWIAGELRRRRQSCGRTRQQAAERLGKATAQIGHLETGRNLPSAADVEVLLTWYGVPERIALFRDLLRRAKKGRDWWSDRADVMPESFGLFLGLEAWAQRLHGYHAVTVPDIFQTPAYAEVTIRGRMPGAPDHELTRRVDLRMARQHLLRRADEPPQIWVVLDEGVLHRPIGGPQVHSAQLDRLVDLADYPNIGIQVLPCTDAGFGGDSAFTWLSLPPDLDVAEGIVHVETLVGSIYYEEPADVATHRQAFDLLRAHALPTDESVTLIEKIANEFRR